MLQEKFFKKEGDEWFKRNRKDLYANAYPDVALHLIDLYDLKPKKVLEIGASNGWRLALIADKYASRCMGVEPSAAAVRDGNKNFPKIKMVRGVASEIPFKEKFDLVIMNLALTWVSREELFKTIAEIDRMIVDGGHLIIGDFLSDYPMRVRYHHKPKDEIYTYKQDYAAIFTSTAIYRSIAQLTFEHAINKFTSAVPMEHRCATSLLKKSYKDFYLTTEHIPRADMP